MNKLDHQKGSRPTAGFRSVVNSLRPEGVRFRLNPMAVMIPLLAGLYVVAANLTLSVGDFSPGMAAVRLQTGVALAALVGLGLRYWSGIVGGALVVEVMAVGFSVQAMVLTMSDTLEAMLGAGLVRRFANGVRAFERFQDCLKFSLLGALGGTSVGAVVATTGFCWPETAPCPGAGSFWVSWWLGGAVGALVAGPLLICWMRQPTFGWLRARKLEVALLLLAIAVVSKAAFGDGWWMSEHSYPWAFLCYPVLAWAAVRFGQVVTFTAVTVLTGMASWGGWEGTGLPAPDDRLSSLVRLQMFLAVMAFTVLVVSSSLAVMPGRRRKVRHGTNFPPYISPCSVQGLKGLLAICATCKKIQNDQGEWEHLEAYIQSRLKTRFTHGMCPDCLAVWRKEHKLTG